MGRDGFFSCLQVWRQWAQNYTQVLSEQQEMLFYCEGGCAQAQVAQGGCGVSLLGGISSLFDSLHPWYVLVVSADVSGDGLEDSAEVASWLWKLGDHRVE